MKLYGPRDTTPDARRILAALAAHEVDCLLIGGFAVAAHGHLRLSRSVDILVPAEPANHKRLAEAIADLGTDEELGAPTRRSEQTTSFDTREGRLVVHRSPAGVRTSTRSWRGAR